MKIAISATKSSFDAPLEERFERCSCFVIADIEGALCDPVRRPRRNRRSGVGIQMSRLLVERGVSVVLTGRCDPKTFEHLASAGLWVVTGCCGTVRQVLERFTADLNGSPTGDTVFSAHSGKTIVDPVRNPRTIVGGGGRRGRRRDRGAAEDYE